MALELRAPNPPTELVSSFVELLDVSDDDYKEESSIHCILNKVVQTIRHNKVLEEKVRNMDLKISLIIRNHLTTHDLICQSKRKTLTRVLSRKSKEFQELSKKRSTTSLIGHSKECQLLLEAYQNLFYLLQTDPKYMAELIFSTTQDFSFKFVESLICTLYNCGCTPRELCLMLKVFGQALQKDVNCKVENITDIRTGKSFVLQIILNFFKTGSGRSLLKNLLQPVVEMIINDESLHLSSDPLEVYKFWINEQETTKGQVLQIPSKVSVEEAERIPEVAERLQKSINDLKNKAEIFFNHIVSSHDLFPYGMGYVAKVLFECLTEKFPEATELEVMKSVGYFVCYRYIIATIPAAETFGVISFKPGKSMNTIQRRNLGAIAKVLQHATAFQVFESTNKLSVLNDFLLTCHAKFLRFLQIVCSVDEPEVFCNLDAYTEATMLTKPEISLTLDEIATCRDLLERHLQDIAPDPYDPLRQVLKDLGPHIVVEPDTADELLTLTLTCSFPVTVELPILDQLLKNTELLVVQFLQCQCSGNNLLEMLRGSTTAEQSIRFQEHIRNVQCKTMQQVLAQFANIDEFKNKILHQLAQLEQAGYVSSQDGYQKIINLIARRIVNRNTYRENRRTEIAKLQHTLCQLTHKTVYLKDTLDFYSEYIENCFHSMEKQVRGSLKRKNLKSSASKLMQKGIILGLSGLDNRQLRHTSFVISTTNTFGVFSVVVRYRSTNLSKVELNFLHLLQLQYEGETVIEISSGAKINVNLLLNFLNKKFLAT